MANKWGKIQCIQESSNHFQGLVYGIVCVANKNHSWSILARLGRGRILARGIKKPSIQEGGGRHSYSLGQVYKYY